MSENKIREYREQAGMTQTELARRAKVAAQNISAIELGKLEAWPRMRRQLARALKVSEKDLFPGKAEVC